MRAGLLRVALRAIKEQKIRGSFSSATGAVGVGAWLGPSAAWLDRHPPMHGYAQMVYIPCTVRNDRTEQNGLPLIRPQPQLGVTQAVRTDRGLCLGDRSRLSIGGFTDQHRCLRPWRAEPLLTPLIHCSGPISGLKLS